MPLPTAEARELREKKSAKGKIKKIHNSFIENAIIKNNLQSLKIVFYLAYILKDIDYGTEGELVCIDVKTDELLGFTGIKSDDLRYRLKSMMQTVITFKDTEGRWEEMTPLIANIKRVYKKKSIELKIFKSIARLIVDVPKEFGGTFLNIEDMMQAQSKHTLRLLPILHMINGFDGNTKKQKYYELEDLNAIFGTNYKRIIDIDNRILKPAQKELNTSGKMGFTYEIELGYNTPIPKGRPKALGVTITPVPRKYTQGKLI